MSFRSCGCFPRMRSIWVRERGQDLWTMCNIKSPGLRRPFRGMRGRDVPSSRRPASRCRGTWQPPAGAQRHWDPAQLPLSVNQNWQQVETAASWKSCSLTGLRRPFRGVRGSWSFRLYGGLPRGVAVLCDRRPTLSCICTPARRDPRSPSNQTFVAVPHSKRNHPLQHISSTTISTKIVATMLMGLAPSPSNWHLLWNVPPFRSHTH